MSKVRNTIRLCDVCGTDQAVERVRIEIGSVKRTGDLCRKHRRGAESVMDKLPAPERQGLGAIPILTEEELAAEARKTARKVNRASKVSGKSDRSGSPGVVGRGASLAPESVTTEGGAR